MGLNVPISGILLLALTIPFPGHPGAAERPHAQSTAQAAGNDERLSGLDTLVPVFEVDDRPLREVLNLLSYFSGLNYIVAEGVPKCQVSAKLTHVTVGQILDIMLPMYGLDWEISEGNGFVRVVRAVRGDFVEVCDPVTFSEPQVLLEYEPLREKLSQILPVFEVDNRPVQEIFNLISRFSEGVNFILCPDIPEDPIPIRTLNRTCGQYLVDLMLECSLVWKPVPGTSAIIVAPRERKNKPLLRDSAAESSPTEIPQATQDLSEIVPELGTVIETFEVKNRPLGEVLNLLSKESGLNFTSFGSWDSPTITASFRNRTVQEILNALAPKYGFRWDVSDSGPFILLGGYHEGPPRVIPAK
jgi:hypothetical protein